MSLGRSIAPLSPGELDKAIVADWMWPSTSDEGQINQYCENKEAKVVTISFDIEVLDAIDTATDTTEGIFFTVRWRSGDSLAQIVEVDAQRGALIAVPARFLSITASYPRITTLNPVTTQPLVRVTASLGFDGTRGSVGTSGIARRTVRIGTVADVPSAIFPIPAFAVSAFMRNSSLAIPAITFAQLRAANAANIITVSPIGKLQTDAVPIADGARFFMVANAAGSPNTSIVFDLGV
jgi:hypothetical protein